ncbi:MAG: rhomboid family intramembrane serine protease [Bacteroides sp.]|nr:rhomboid family intramembrane serine protease [Bacteroides sp.]
MNTMPPVTKNLLIINVLMFLGTLVAERYGIYLDSYLSLHFFMADNFNILQLISYMFMHGGWAHLFFNMFALWMFGRVLEEVWGPKRFLFYYLVCGIGAGLIQEAVQFVQFHTMFPGLTADMMINTERGMMVVSQALNGWRTVGASGAVYGILLGFGMLFPNNQLFIIPFPFPIKAKFFVIGYAALELILGVSNNANDNVAHFAHLGGMIFGFILIMYWKKKNVLYWKGRKMNDNETSYFR